MTVQELLLRGTELFKKEGIPEPYQNAERIIRHALNLSRTELYSEFDKELLESEYQRILYFLQRRTLREPLQYILEYAEFYGLKFIVTRDVLIPRPETELIIETALKIINRNGQILDIGTGSGNIAITLKKLLPSAKVFGLDISPKAIAVAKINAVRHGLLGGINLLVADLFNGISPKIKFDAILSNPPYIPTPSIQNLDQEIWLYEPVIALDGGIDGMKYIREIINSAYFYLKSGGILIIEIDEGQGEKVISIAEKTKEYSDLEVKRDLQGFERVFVARRK